MSNTENMIDMKKEVKKLYIKLQKESGFKIGDTVRVTRIAQDFESGWQHIWMMDKTVGKIYKVKGIHEYEGIQLENGFSYPFFILEKIEKTYHIGQRFKYCGETYILANVGINSVNLINKDDGRRFSIGGVKINDTRKITEKQMQELVDEFLITWKDFKLVTQ